MATFDTNLFDILQICCPTLEALELYIAHHAIDVSHPAVVSRRNEIFNDQLITDSDTYRLLTFCCNSLEELEKVVLEHGLDKNDITVRARERILQVNIVQYESCYNSLL